MSRATILAGAAQAALLFALAGGLPARGEPGAGKGHTCAGGEEARFGYDAFRDRACRSETEHVCRCRPREPEPPFYDSKRDLCLDSRAHFACVERNGDYACAKGRCACDTEPRRCKGKDLEPWQDRGCAWGNCREGERLRGREPRPGIVCRGGERWACVQDRSCPTSLAPCGDADFSSWRAVGCGVGGCGAGGMRWLRERRTTARCLGGAVSRCERHPVCAKPRRSNP